MWRFSLLALCLCALPTAAAADPLTAAVAAAKNFGAWFAAQGFITQALIRLGASFILSTIAQALTPRPNQKRQLNLPTSRPPKRFLYGRVRTYGTSAWRVRGRFLYGCIVLNSRPSHGGDIRIFMDKRECKSNDPTDFTTAIYDFSGPGARLDDIEDFRAFGDSANWPRVWIGLGDQTGPPQAIRSAVPEFFETTDAGRGLTVMWIRLAYGSSRRAQRRWRAVPPEIEVEMDWSRVWDMRDESQDPEDPDTWTFSSNQALCLLDALRQNPIRRYPLRQVHLPSFTDAASVADEQVPLYYDSVEAGVWPATPLTEPRYTANGLLIWTAGELADQLTPIAQAGAGDLVRLGGQVGYAAGEYRAPSYTATDIIESGGIEYSVLRPGRDLPRFVKAGYVSPRRDWQEAELMRIPVEGAEGGVDEDGVLELTLLFVTSPTQAMRIQQIVARQLARQKTLSVTFWPDAMDVVAGATVLTAFPAPFTRLNGEWTVTSATPAVWTADELSETTEIAMRIPATLRQNDEQVWEWDPAADEQEVRDEIFDPVRRPAEDPGAVTLESGEGISLPGQARLRVSFDAAEGADEYEIFLRELDDSLNPATEYVGGVFVDQPPSPDVISVTLSANAFVRYQAAVQARSFFAETGRSLTTLRLSDLIESPATGTLAIPLGYDLGIPTNGSATGGVGEIEVSFTAPASLDYVGMEIWVNTTDDAPTATLLSTRAGAAGAVETFTHTGLGADETRYYFARSIGTFGARSDFTASVTATTDP